jgi:hypothetical protein
MESLLTPGPRRRVYGELVSLLAQRGDVESALAIEALGHELSRSHGLRILCGYSGHAGLTGDDRRRIAEAHDGPVPETRVPGDRSGEPSAMHAVRFYEDRASLARLVARFLGEGLVAGLPAIVIATPEHREAIRAALLERGVDVHGVEGTGSLIMADAHDMLGRFMVNGMPSVEPFRQHVVPIIEQACAGRPDRVTRVYGEMVDVLWKGGQTEAAIRLEMLWNQLAQTHTFALLCGYSIGNFYKAAGRREICAQHTHLVSDDAGSAALP